MLRELITRRSAYAMARGRRTTRPARRSAPAGDDEAKVRFRWTLTIVALSAPGLAVFLLSGALDLKAAAVAILLGLAAIGVAYSIWSALHPKHWRGPLRFLRDIVKPVVPLLALLGLALVFQGFGDIMGWGGLHVLGRTVAELFGGS